MRETTASNCSRPRDEFFGVFAEVGAQKPFCVVQFEGTYLIRRSKGHFMATVVPEHFDRSRVLSTAPTVRASCGSLASDYCIGRAGQFKRGQAGGGAEEPRPRWAWLARSGLGLEPRRPDPARPPGPPCPP
jgi:hypothetical protein